MTIFLCIYPTGPMHEQQPPLVEATDNEKKAAAEDIAKTEACSTLCPPGQTAREGPEGRPPPKGAGYILIGQAADKGGVPDNHVSEARSSGQEEPVQESSGHCCCGGGVGDGLSGCQSIFCPIWIIFPLNPYVGFCTCGGRMSVVMYVCIPHLSVFSGGALRPRCRRSSTRPTSSWVAQT